MTPPRSIVALTGAGISAESGVSTFRDVDGIWSKVRIEDVATPDAFRRDPGRVQSFYNERRRALDGIMPNAAHHALARLEHDFSGDFLLVTQNIDDLHEQAGTQNLIHMHGELKRALCAHCGERSDAGGDLASDLACPACAQTGGMRPDVVWFGEMPYRMDDIYLRLSACDLFVSIGTSGTVYPAAGFVEEARLAGAHTIELNLEPSLGRSLFHDADHGPASVIVPAFVDEILASAQG